MSTHLRHSFASRALLLIVLGWPAVAAAGPWTAKRGHGQLILTGSFYVTHENFDQDGDGQEYGFDGRFEKPEFNPYFEIGITDRLAAMSNLFASHQEFSNQFGRLNNAGPGDTEVGLRYRLTSDASALVVALQGVVKLPTATDGGEIALGNGQVDTDIRLAVGGALGSSSLPPFWNVDAGVRLRDDEPADEIRVDASFGAYTHPRLMLLAQLGAIKGLKNEDHGFDAFGNPTLSPDYDLYRLQGSLVVRLSSRVRVQGGAFSHVAGRNTGAGWGAIFSTWLEF